jgi:periplasmic protein TonB
MTQTAFYEPRKGHPVALSVVLLMHGAAIGALALAKMDVIGPDVIPPTIVELIKDPPPPPPNEPEPVAKIQPQQQTVIDKPPPLVEFPAPGPVTEWKVTPPAEVVIATPVPIVVEKADPPAPPPPKKLEPARARANLASYVSDEDYPAAAIRAEDQGTTRFRLGVGPDGRVTDCTVTGSSGSSALDAATCRLMKQRARFTPARDSSGNPTSDSVSSAIRWVLPDG